MRLDILSGSFIFSENLEVSSRNNCEIRLKCLYCFRPIISLSEKLICKIDKRRVNEEMIVLDFRLKGLIVKLIRNHGYGLVVD